MAKFGPTSVQGPRPPQLCRILGDSLSLICSESGNRTRKCLTVNRSGTISDLKKLISRELHSHVDDQNCLLVRNSKVLTFPASTRLADTGLKAFDTITLVTSRTQLFAGMNDLARDYDDRHQRAPEGQITIDTVGNKVRDQYCPPSSPGPARKTAKADGIYNQANASRLAELIKSVEDESKKRSFFQSLKISTLQPISRTTNFDVVKNMTSAIAQQSSKNELKEMLCYRYDQNKDDPIAVEIAGALSRYSFQQLLAGANEMFRQKIPEDLLASKPACDNFLRLIKGRGYEEKDLVVDTRVVLIQTILYLEQTEEERQKMIDHLVAAILDSSVASRYKLGNYELRRIALQAIFFFAVEGDLHCSNSYPTDEKSLEFLHLQKLYGIDMARNNLDKLNKWCLNPAKNRESIDDPAYSQSIALLLKQYEQESEERRQTCELLSYSLGCLYEGLPLHHRTLAIAILSANGEVPEKEKVRFSVIKGCELVGAYDLGMTCANVEVPFIQNKQQTTSYAQQMLKKAKPKSRIQLLIHLPRNTFDLWFAVDEATSLVLELISQCSAPETLETLRGVLLNVDLSRMESKQDLLALLRESFSGLNPETRQTILDNLTHGEVYQSWLQAAQSAGAQGEVSIQQEFDVDKPLIRSLNDGADATDALSLVDLTEQRLDKPIYVNDLPKNFNVTTQLAFSFPLVACAISSQRVLVTNMALAHHNQIYLDFGEGRKILNVLPKKLTKDERDKPVDFSVIIEKGEMLLLINFGLMDPFAADASMAWSSRWRLNSNQLKGCLKQTLANSRAVHNLKDECKLIVEKDNQMYIYTHQNMSEIPPKTLDGQTIKLAEVESTTSYENIYFVQKDAEDKATKVIALKKKTAIVSTELAVEDGEILAIQVDYDHEDVETREQLFILQQDKVSLWTKSLSSTFERLSFFSLSQVVSLHSTQINAAFRKKFLQVSMSSRCITIEGKTFVYATGEAFFNRKIENQSSDIEQKNISSRRVAHHDFDVHFNFKKEKINYEAAAVTNYLIIEKRADSRRCSVVQRGLRWQVMKCEFVAKDLLLVKFANCQWTLIGPDGVVRSMPHQLSKFLQEEAVDEKNNGGVVAFSVLSNGQQQSIVYSKKKMAVVRFSPKGVFLTCEEIAFEKQYFETKTILSDHGGTQFIRHCKEKYHSGNVLQIDESGDDKVYTLMSNFNSPTDIAVLGGKIIAYAQQERKLVVFTKEQLKSSKTCKNDAGKVLIRISEISEATIIDLTRNGCWDQSPKSCFAALSACSMKYIIDRACQNDFSPQRILSQKMNLLQVELRPSGRILIFDLSQDGMPLVHLHDEANMLAADPESFVLTGMEPKTIALNHTADLFIHKKLYYETYCGYVSRFDFNEVLGVFRTVSALDVAEARRLLQDYKGENLFDTKAFLATFEGHSLFSLLDGNIKLFQVFSAYIADKLSLKEVEEEKQDMFKLEATQLRAVLQQRPRCKTMQPKSSDKKSEQEAKEIQSFSVVTRNLKDIEMRDIFLKMLTNCSFAMEHCLRDVSEFKQILEYASPYAIELFNSNCFYETPNTQTIQTLKWPSSIQSVLYSSDWPFVTQEEIQKAVDEKTDEDDNVITKAVTVFVADLRWLVQDNNAFINLAQALIKTKNEAIYITQFTQQVVDFYWGMYKTKMIKKLFLPYLASLVANVYYYWFALERRGVDVERREEMLYYRIGFAIFTLALHARQIYCECVQIKAVKSCKEYYDSIWNYNDAFWLLMSPVVVLVSIPSITPIPQEMLVTMSSFVTFSMMINLFQWMRLFESTAFYVELVIQTLVKILPFMILLLVSLAIFGVPMILLNMNRVDDDSNPVVPESFGFMLPNLFVNQYLLALGEFSMDGFVDADDEDGSVSLNGEEGEIVFSGSENQAQEGICFILFLMATFFSQVTMLNMLIAIMGDKYSEVIENQELNSTKTKLQLVSEYAANLMESSGDRNNNIYFFLATPDEQEGDLSTSWEGSIKSMSKFTEKRISATESVLQKQTEKLEKKVSQLFKEQETQLISSRAVQDKVEEKINGLDAKFNSLDAKMDKLFTLLQKQEEEKDQ